MSIWDRLFGRKKGDYFTTLKLSGTAQTEETNRNRTVREKKKMYSRFKNMYKEERDRLTEGVLGGVTVRPGENPYRAGASALLHSMADRGQQARDTVMRRVSAKYNVSKEELLSILKEGDEGRWEQ